MPRDEWDTVDDWETGEWDEDAPDDEDGESLTVPCPSCGEQIYEEAERCPCCGEYVVHSSRVWQGKPSWWILLGGLGIVATIIALSGM
jgi:hypothetical protein